MAIIIAACNHISTLVVCVPKSGNTYYIITLSILLFFIILEIYSRILIILFITSFELAEIYPCYSNFLSVPIAKPEFFVDKSNVNIFINQSSLSEDII